MNFKAIAVFILASLSLLGALPAQAASVTGTVKWEGPVPPLKPLDMASDPTCAGKYEGKDKPVSQALELGEGNTMGNIVIKVISGLPADKTYPAPTTPALIKQHGCVYEPHVFAVMKDQPIKFVNSDGVQHNVHALPEINRQFNVSMPKTMTETNEMSFKEKECTPFRIKCDIHPWMLSYACVMDHPFYYVTSKDGSYKIENLPAGSYEIQAWHEKAGTKVSQVTVAEADAKVVDFTFSRAQ